MIIVLFLIGLTSVAHRRSEKRATRQFWKQLPCSSNLCTSNTINEAIPPTNGESQPAPAHHRLAAIYCVSFPHPPACDQRLASPVTGWLTCCTCDCAFPPVSRNEADALVLPTDVSRNNVHGQHFRRNGTRWRNSTTAYPNKFRRSGI